MLYTEVRLYQGQPSTTEGTIFTAGTTFTAPNGTVINNVQRIIIKAINIANTNSSPVTLSASLVPSGGTAGNANRLIPGGLVPANSESVVDTAQVMYPNETLSAIQGTAGAITLTISAVVVSS